MITLAFYSKITIATTASSDWISHPHKTSQISTCVIIASAYLLITTFSRACIKIKNCEKGVALFFIQSSIRPA